MPVAESALFRIASLAFGIDNLSSDGSAPVEYLDQSGRRKLALRAGLNCDLPQGGMPQRRAGLTRISSSAAHSLWRDARLPFALYVRGSQLCRIDEDLSVTALASVYGRVACGYHAGAALWSDGVQTGSVSGAGALGTWGLPVPPTPVLTARSGSLTEGRYRVALTCETAAGEESGAEMPAEIDIADGQAIEVSAIPTGARADVRTINVYGSLPHSEELYWCGSVPIGSTASFVIDAAQLKQGDPLETLLLAPPPAGHIVRAAFGRVLVAQGATIAFAEPYAPGLFDAGEGTITFASRVTMLEPTLDGWYLGTEAATYFLSGGDPDEHALVQVDRSGVVEGCSAPLERYATNDAGSALVCWLGRNGIAYVGAPSGQVKPLAEGRYKAGRFAQGAMLARFAGGARSILFTATSSDRAGRFLADTERGSHR